LQSPYPLQENDEFSYEFATSREIRYKIYFLDYGYMFSGYPQINCPVYLFNIDVIEGSPDDTAADERIGVTVASIFSLFFTTIKNVAV
jgi:hypothetical protein